MAVKNISKLFKPGSIALFGASDSETKPGGVILRNLRKSGFKGPIYPINPKHHKIGGRKVYGTLEEVPRKVDLAVIATPAAVVPTIIQQCGKQGVEAAIIISAGFGEAGTAGKELEQELVTAARLSGIRFLGPNCLGLVRPDIGLNASFGSSTAIPGKLALVSQSGALCSAILDWAAANGIGFSNVISTGDAADIDFGEILDFLILDTKTNAIMLYVEGVRDARKFMSALRAAARVKPVVVMKSGRHHEGSKAAVTHTGAILGSDDIFDAAIRRAGVVRVASFANFFSAAETLDLGVRVSGKRLAIVTNAGGPAVMAADYLADKELQLAQLSPDTIRQLDAALNQRWSRSNPVDVLGDADPERFSRAVAVCLEDKDVDAVLAVLAPQAMTQPEEVARAVITIAGQSKKPIFTTWMGEKSILSSRALFRESRIPTYRTPEAAVESFAVAATYHENQQLLLQVPDPLSFDKVPDLQGGRMIVGNALADHRRVLTPSESKGLLAAFRIPIIQSILAQGPSDALVAAEGIGFPVALKIDSPDITHKSDVGGVELNIRSAEDLPGAVRQLLERVQRRVPNARIRGVLIEPMWDLRGVRELMIGVSSDPIFGPAISFGMGGSLVEVIRDRATALPPLNNYLVQKMLSRSRASRCLGEFRGNSPVNQKALEEVLLRVSEMVCEMPMIKELDINPLLANENRVVAADARVVVEARATAETDYAHMAIHPYPGKLAHNWDLPDGTVVRIRPIRPEDAVIERAFVSGLSDQSRYYRFMYALRELTPEMLSRFTQIDYDREMAMIAVLGDPPNETQIGVARYITLPNGETCEFAVVVADAWQGKGVAMHLVRPLIEHARAKGLTRMNGLVLAENTNMLRFAKMSGFTITPDPEDSSIMSISLNL